MRNPASHAWEQALEPGRMRTVSIADPLLLAAQIASGQWSPRRFRYLFHQVSPTERDVWWNKVLALDEVTQDGGELPVGCVPYMPSPVNALWRVVEHCPLGKSDVFVDVGCGNGRAALLVHLLTGARILGLDVQSHLVNAARGSAAHLNLSEVDFAVADVCERTPVLGSVYYLYCPFGADRVTKFLNNIRPLAALRPLTVACLDVVLPACDWLVPRYVWPDLQIFRSVDC